MSLGSLAPETGISTAGGTQASEVPTERPGSGGGPDPAHSDAGNGLGGFSSKPPTSPGKPQVLAVTPWPSPSCPGSLWPLLAPSSLPPGPVPGPLCKFFFSLREPWEKFLSPSNLCPVTVSMRPGQLGAGRFTSLCSYLFHNTYHLPKNSTLKISFV